MLAPAFTHRVRITESPADAPRDPFLKLPAQPGVALFTNNEGEPITLLTSADLRQLARSRLHPEHAANSSKSLIGAASMIEYALAESEAERSLLWLLHAHEHLPRLADEQAKTPPCWFLRLDAREEYPKARPLGPRELIGLDDLLGVYAPYPSRKVAARAGEAVTDALDLCRHHHLLVLEPHASACAYKDMGRCPAPCDGSESMARYRERVSEGQRWLEDAIRLRAEAQAEMRDASERLDFERASRQKALIERTAPLIMSDTRAIAGAEWCVLMLGADKQSVHAIIVTPGHAQRVAESVAPDQAAQHVVGWQRSPTPPLDTRGADLLGWMGELACLPDDKNFGRRSSAVIPLPAAASEITIAATDMLARAEKPPTIE